MAVLTSQQIANTGLNSAYSAASASGDSFVNTGREFLHVKNGSGSSVTVTIATEQTVEGLAVADATVTIPAGEDRFIGPFATNTFNDSDRQVNFTYSSETSVTVAVMNIN